MFGDKARKFISKIGMFIAAILMILNLKMATIAEDQNAHRVQARAAQIQEFSRDNCLEKFHAMAVDKEDQP